MIHKVKFGIIAPKHAYFGNFLTEMESLGNFLQNDTKFVQMPKWLRRYCNLKYGRYPLFSPKPQFLNKIENIGFFYKLYKQTKFHANRRCLVNKFWVI